MDGITVTAPDGTVEVLYKPHPQQLKFHSATAPYRLFGGAAGGGKSTALRFEAYARCMQIPGYRVLLLRRVLPELKSTHLRELPMELSKLLGLGRRGGPSYKDVYRATDYTVTWPNGSILQFGSCDNDDSVTKFLSTEYDAAFFDELTTFPLNMYRMIESRVGRRAGMPWTIAAGTNPVGIGAAWVKALWITKDPDPDEAPNYDPNQYAYVPAGVEDNPSLSPDYALKLENLPSEALRRAYRYGSWEFLEGQFFSQFRSHKDGEPWHVLLDPPSVGGMDVRRHPQLEWFRAIDWGVTSDAVCGWYCCLPNGRVVKVYERVWKAFIPAEQMGREICDFTKKNIAGKVRYTVVDPKAFTREGALGVSVAEALTRGGVPCLKADNERELGWHQVQSWMTTLGDDGKPLLQFWGPGTPQTIKTIPTLVRHKTRTDDIHHLGVNDHCADETRYALMSRPAPTKIKAKPDERIAATEHKLDPVVRDFFKPRRKALNLKTRFSLKVN